MQLLPEFAKFSVIRKLDFKLNILLPLLEAP